MFLDQETLRFIFGLKLRTLRQNKGLSLKQLSLQSGLSPSYINEIEKGKKYPKSEKIIQLAKSLGVSYDELISLKLSDELKSLSRVLENNVFKELPFEVFGIPAQSLFELLGDNPTAFSTLMGTFLELARNHKIQVEDFFFATLRALTDKQNNYFPDLEEKVVEFNKEFGLSQNNKERVNFFNSDHLKFFLEKNYNYKIIVTDFSQFSKEIHDLHYFYTSNKGKRLYLNSIISQREMVFLLSREIALNYLGFDERVPFSHNAKLDSFDQLYNHFKAGYFATALLIPKDIFLERLKDFFNQDKWNQNEFTQWSQEYPGTFEGFALRLTQMLPTFFEIDQIFFWSFEQAVDEAFVFILNLKNKIIIWKKNFI